MSMRPPTPEIPNRATLSAYVEDRATRLDGRLGVLLGFPTGPDGEFDVVVERSADQPYASASVIKLPVMYALYQQHNGELDELNEPRSIRSENSVGGAGLLHLLDNVEPSLRDLGRAMIDISDNAATNELIDYVGIDAVNEAATTLGLEHTRLGRKLMMDFDFEGEDTASEMVSEPTNTTSPRDCARLFGELLHGNDLTEEARTEQLSILGDQKDPSMFPRYFPYETPVAHKTGWLPQAALDTGLLEREDGPPLFFAVFCDRVSHGGDATDAIAEIGDATLAWLGDDQ